LFQIRDLGLNACGVFLTKESVGCWGARKKAAKQSEGRGSGNGTLRGKHPQKKELVRVEKCALKQE